MLKIFIDDTVIQNSATFGAFSRNMDFSLLTPNNSFAIKSIITLGIKRNFKIK